MYIYIIVIILLVALFVKQDVLFGGVTYDNFSGKPETCTPLGCTDASMNPYFNRKAADKRDPPSYARLSKGIVGRINQHVEPLPVHVGKVSIKLPTRKSGKPNPYRARALPITLGRRSSPYTLDKYTSNGIRPLSVEYGEVKPGRQQPVSFTREKIGVLPVVTGKRDSTYVTPVYKGSESGVLPVALGRRKSPTQRTIYNVSEAVPLGKRGDLVRPVYHVPSYAGKNAKALGIAYGRRSRVNTTVSQTNIMPSPLGVTWMKNKAKYTTTKPSKSYAAPLPVDMQETPKPKPQSSFKRAKAVALPVAVKESFGNKMSNPFNRPRLTKTQNVVRNQIEYNLQNLMEENLTKAQLESRADDTLSIDAQMTWARNVNRSKASLNTPGVPSGIAKAYSTPKKPELVLNRQTWGWDKPSFMY